MYGESRRKSSKKTERLKKKIKNLFVMGGITESEKEEQLKSAEVLSSQADAGTSGPPSNKNRTRASSSMSRVSVAISRKISAARIAKAGGPQIQLNLSRLNGARLCNADIAQLVHYSAIGAPKPKWVQFKPFRATQTVVIRVNCPSQYIENDDRNRSMSFVEEFFERTWFKTDNEVGDRNKFWAKSVFVAVSSQEQMREIALQRQTEEKSDSSATKSLKVDMVLSVSELSDNSYPFPEENRFIATKEKYLPVSDNSPIFSVDCEMCITTAGYHELARISVIDENCHVVMDTLVKPDNEITDYLTQFSGITKELLENADVVKLADVQNALRVFLPPDAILVGHSLEFDLRALRMAHPYCIDVAVAYNISGSSKIKSSLRSLASAFLEEDIQSGFGHCSIEDSWAALRLVKLKFGKGIEFGNVRYGWDYNEFKEASSNRSVKADEGPGGKKKRVDKPHSRERSVCCKGCGRSTAAFCTVADCPCRMFSLPKRCIRCLSGKMGKKRGVEGTIDWSASLRVDRAVKTRPLAYYLTTPAKTALCAFRDLEEVDVEFTRTVVKMNPTTSKNDFVDEVACALLNHNLALIELDFENREAELQIMNNLQTSCDSSDQSADGLAAEAIRLVSKEMSDGIEKIIRSAAKFSLVLLLLASSSSTILYLRVKP